MSNQITNISPSQPSLEVVVARNHLHCLAQHRCSKRREYEGDDDGECWREPSCLLADEGQDHLGCMCERVLKDVKFNSQRAIEIKLDD